MVKKLFLLLALFWLLNTFSYAHSPHTRAYGETWYYATQSEALSACYHYISGHVIRCERPGGLNYYRSDDSDGGYWVFGANICSDDFGPGYTLNTSTHKCEQGPTDADCQARQPKEIWKPATSNGVMTITIGVENAIDDGCLYQTADSASPEYMPGRCKIDNDQVVCSQTYTPVSASTSAPQGTPDTTNDPTFENAPDQSGGQKDTSTSTSAPTVQPDTPSAGDTTTIETTTDQTTYTDQTSISNTTTQTVVEQIQGGDVTKTTTTTTTNHADGSTTEVVNVAYTQTAINQTQHVLHWANGTTFTSNSTTPATSTGTTSTTVTGIDGSQSTTTTGQDGSGDREGDEEGQDFGDFTAQQRNAEGLYDPDETLTYSGVLNDFVTDVQQTPAFSSITGFFNVTVGGTCPVWSSQSVSGGFFVFPSLTIDQHCSQVMETIWPFIYAIVLLVASYGAYRIAVL